MFVKYYAVLALVTALTFFASVSRADEAPRGYPGNWVRPDGKIVVGTNIALRLVQEGVYAYQYAYGTWPASWSEVTEAGICQVSLMSPQGYQINPDDGNLDFMWDVVYIPADGYYGPPKTSTIMDVDGPYNSLDPFELNDSLEQMVAKMKPEQAAQYQGLVENRDWRTLAAIRRYSNNMIIEHYYLKGWPKWDEFFGSLWCPIDSSSVNPLTGEGFKLNGSPNDFAVTVANKEGMPSLQITDQNGMIPFAIYP
jgi:hypothetical protein